MLGPEQINVTHRPTPIFLEGTTPVRVTEEIALQLGLKDGQTVRAVIENRGDLLRLILNQRDLNWSGSSRFKPGDKVDLKVSFGANGVTLTPVAASTGQNVAKPLINMLPTSLLSLVHRPNQAAILNSVLKPGGLDQVLGYVGAREWAQKLEQLKTSMGRLTPSAVKQGLASSGLFGESLLISGRHSPKPDLKQVAKEFNTKVHEINVNQEKDIVNQAARTRLLLSATGRRRCASPTQQSPLRRDFAAFEYGKRC